jgi:hypothetical protein
LATIIDHFESYKFDHLNKLLPIWRSALDFADNQFSLVLQHSPGLSDEIKVVGSHQGETKHAEVCYSVFYGQVCNVSLFDERFEADQVVGAYLLWIEPMFD